MKRLLKPTPTSRRVPHPRASGRVGLAVGVVFLGLTVGIGPAVFAEEVFVLTGRVAPAVGPVPKETRVAVLPALGREARGRVDLRQLEEPKPVVVAEPGADGRFRLEVPGRGMWVVRVTAPGHVPVELHRMPLLNDQELPPAPLLPDVGLEVEVVDDEGRRVPGARVGLLPDLDGPLWREAGRDGWRPARRLLSTDREGRLRMPWARGESGGLRAYRLGGAEGPVATTRGEAVRLRLPPSLDRFLRLRRIGGGPLAGFGVRVGEWRWRAATADEEGWALVAAPREGGPFSVESPEGWRLDLELAPVQAPGGSAPAPDSGAAAGAESAEGPVHLEVQVEVPLPPPQVVAGRVMSEETGEGLVGAMVWLEHRPRDPVWTDRHGRFSLELAPGRSAAQVLATAEGHHSWGRSGWSAGDQLVIFLAPARRLEGRTVDAAGDAVGGARVWLRPKGFRGGWDAGRKLERVSGLDGRFDFGLRRADLEYEVRASAPGLLSTVEAWDPMTVGARDLVLRAPAQAAGRIVAADGGVLAAAHVQLYRDRRVQGPQQVGDAELESESDAEGRFLLSPLPAETFILEVRREGYATRLLLGLEPVPGQVLDLGDVILEPGGALAGRVVDERGEPVTGATVVAYPARREGGARLEGGRDHRVTTDQDGAFRLADLRAGTRYTLEANRETFRRGHLSEVEVPAEDLELELPTGAHVFGRVVDTAGEPVPRARLELVVEQEARGSAGRSAQTLQHLADHEGRFRFDHIPHGRTVVQAREGSRMSGKGLMVDTEAGEEYGPLRVVLEEGAAVAGTVFDPRGRPLPGVYVNLTPEKADARGVADTSSHAKSQADGSYRVEGAVPGPVFITVVRDAHRILETHVELLPGDQRLDLTVEEYSLIAGRVTDGEGRPVEGAVVRGTVDGPDGSSSMMVHSDDQGRFTFTGAPAGRLAVHALAPRHAPKSLGPMPFDGSVLEGLELVLEAGTVLQGAVLGVPPEDWSRISVAAQRAPVDSRQGYDWTEHTGVVRYDGTYEVPSLGPGVWRVRAVLGTDGRETSGSVDIGQGQARAHLDLEFEPGITLEGRVWLNDQPLAVGDVSLVGEAGTRRSANTNQDGRFRFAGLEGGEYYLAVSAGVGDGTSRFLELWGDRRLEIRLRLAELSGRLVAADGQPMAGRRLDLIRLDGEEGSKGRSNGTYTDEDGRFSYRNVAEGRYRLAVDDRGRGSLVTELQVTAPETRLGNLSLRPVPVED